MKSNQKKYTNNRDYYKNRLKVILQYVNLKDATIMDLGCGEMILYDLVHSNIRNYLGIDKYSFANTKNFVLGDIFDKNMLDNRAADFIFLLGVLDHIMFEEKVDILESCSNKFNTTLIISQRNPASFFNLFYKKIAPVINIQQYFENHHIVELYLFKLPFMDLVFDLSKYHGWIQKCCTEVIYLISSK